MTSFNIILTWNDVTDKKKMIAGAKWTDIANSNAKAYKTGNGTTVIDIDTHDMSKVDKKLAKLLKDFKPNVKTKRGTHYYFKSEDFKSVSSIFKGVDIRSRGGIVYYEYTGSDDRIFYEVQHNKVPKMPKKLFKYLNKQPAMNKPENKELEAWADASPFGKPTVDEVLEALTHVHDYEERDPWMQVGRALHSWDSDLGWDIFNTWSKQWEHYNIKEVKAFWNSLYGGNDHVTIGTLFYMAKLAGYNYVPKKNYEGLYNIISSSEFVHDFKPSTWLIKDILPSSELGECFGASQSRKTFVVLDQAVCIQNGMEWQGHETTQADVLYICGEGVNGVRLRLAGFAEHYKAKSEIDILPVPVDMMDDASMVELCKAIDSREKKYGLIVIDTLNANFLGDENSADDFAKMKRNLKDHICNDERMVMWVHHTGNTERGRARGSSARFAGVDFSMQVTAVGDLSTVENKKMKDAEHFDKMTLGFEVVDCNLGFGSENFTSLVPVTATNEDLEHEETKQVNNPYKVAYKEFNNCELVDVPNEMQDLYHEIDLTDANIVRYEEFKENFMVHYANANSFNKWIKQALEEGKILLYITNEGGGRNNPKTGFIYWVE